MKFSYLNARVLPIREDLGTFCQKRVQALGHPNLEEIEACIPSYIPVS